MLPSQQSAAREGRGALRLQALIQTAGAGRRQTTRRDCCEELTRAQGWEERCVLRWRVEEEHSRQRGEQGPSLRRVSAKGSLVGAQWAGERGRGQSSPTSEVALGLGIVVEK